MKKISSLLVVVFLCGCATFINHDYQKINFSDGVNKDEAVIIAKKYCFDHRDVGCGGSTSVGDGDIGFKNYFPYKGEWVIYFNRIFIVTIIEVNKKSGEVIRVNYDGI